MELVELLDKIDETAPVGCQTCVHMATHDNCDGCLGSGRPPGEPFEYNNHEPGNWLRRVDDFERRGLRSVVIGGQGEAEVCMRQTPAEVSKNLHYVAEQCGYMVGRLTKVDAGLSLVVSLHHGSFRIHWETTNKDEAGKLHHIDRLDDDGKRKRQSWPSF